MQKDLYLDAEWFIGGDIFLIGWAHNTEEHGQLYDDSLSREQMEDLLEATTGIIYFYGPDIGIIEKFFGIDIRSHHHCVNLIKVFKDKLPGIKNYKLATIEKLYNLQRNRNEYKANIFSIFQDWRKPQVRSLVLQYNMEDVLNLVLLKTIIFCQFKVATDYLHQVRLSGPFEIIKSHVTVLPADVYRGRCIKRQGDGECLEIPNITSQMVIGAKFYNDKVSLYRMIVLMHDVVRNNRYDIITSVNNRDNPFDLAMALAKGVALRMRIPYQECFSNFNAECTRAVKNKDILIIDDVLYKGRTMEKAITACTKRGPKKVHFLVFGKSQKSAY